MPRRTRTEACHERPETIGLRLRNLRQLRGMTIDQLSEATGASVGFISQLENRPDKSVSIERIEAFARALGVSEASLLPRWNGHQMGPGEQRFVSHFLALPDDKKQIFCELMEWYVRGRKE